MEDEQAMQRLFAEAQAQTLLQMTNDELVMLRHTIDIELSRRIEQRVAQERVAE